MNKSFVVICIALCSVVTNANGLWHVTALDPQTLVLQGDYSAYEHSVFKLTPQEAALTGWKFDKAFGAASTRAQSHRPETEAKLAAGPYVAKGATIAEFGFWKYPMGASRYPDREGNPKGVRLAEVMEIVYLKLADPLKSGAKVAFTLPTGEHVDWAYEPENNPTPIIKVNQVGYAPTQGKKFAYLGAWLGPKFGAYQPKEGLQFELVDAKSGKVVKKGPLSFRVPDREKDNNQFCGEKTLEMDFSDITTPGRYFVRVPGVGRSLEFPIDESSLGAAFAVHMQGLFQQRCGCAKTESLTHWTDKPCHMDVVRGIQPPNEWEYGSCFTDKDGKQTKLTHFPVITAMTRDYTEHMSIPGGWHDAADYDRRPMHLEIVNGLASLYLLRTESFTDSQLAVPERGNGIPDILDEALWGIRHLRAAQQKDGGVGTWIETRKHPAPNDNKVASGDDLVYCLSRATRSSSLLYASHASLIARAFLKVGSPAAKKIADDYRESAIAAWKFSQGPVPGPVKMRCGWEQKKEVEVYYQEPDELDPNELVKAAVNLYVLTGDNAYLSALESIEKRFVGNSNKKGWCMGPERHAEFLFTEIKNPVYEKLRAFWNKRIVSEADAMIQQEEGPDSYAYRTPWYAYTDWRVNTMSWGNCHPLRRARAFCYAHALTGDRKYLDAAYLANDYHNGCNPNGATWTTGLGVVYPVSYLSIVSVGDGIAEYVPGITPYRNTYGVAGPVKELVWSKKPELSKWPFWRQYPNIEEFTVANSEFTVWETVAPAAFTTGYLMTPGAKVPLVNRVPAKDVRDLPGFWAMP